MKRRKFILCLAGTAAAGLTGWQVGRLTLGRPLVKVAKNGHALGSTVTITVFHRDRRSAEKALAEAFTEINRIEDLLSLYRPESQISRLNRDNRLEAPHPYFREVLQASMELSASTGGAFDVTIQPLWKLYFDHAETGTLPEPAAIREALASVDWKQVRVTADSVELTGRKQAITLNGIAQGFVADKVGEVLSGHGIEHALIDTGEIGSIGSHAEKDAWSIGIKHPREPQELLGLAGLSGRALATSGDYETRFSEDYQLHHLLDPRTGRSPAELASVSVAATTAMEADALSTATFLLGLEKGRALIEATPGADALFVTKDGAVVQTDTFPSLG